MPAAEQLILSCSFSTNKWKMRLHPERLWLDMYVSWDQHVAVLENFWLYICRKTEVAQTGFSVTSQETTLRALQPQVVMSSGIMEELGTVEEDSVNICVAVGILDGFTSCWKFWAFLIKSRQKAGQILSIYVLMCPWLCCLCCLSIKLVKFWAFCPLLMSTLSCIAFEQQLCFTRSLYC